MKFQLQTCRNLKINFYFSETYPLTEEKKKKSIFSELAGTEKFRGDDTKSYVRKMKLDNVVLAYIGEVICKMNKLLKLNVLK